MSLLKDKRIQKLLQVDSDDDDDGGPPTSNPFAQKNKQRRKVRKQAEQHQQRVVEEAITAVADPSKEASAEVIDSALAVLQKQQPTPALVAEDNKAKHKEKKRAPKATGGAGPGANASPKASSAGSKGKKARAPTVADDDDALLDEMMRENGHADSEDETSEGRAGGSSRLLGMIAADPKQLDYRTERVRAFGKESVQDISGAELKKLGYQLPKIKKGPFVSPNLGNETWLVMGASGDTVSLEVDERAGRGGDGAPIPYMINAANKEYKAAHSAFEFTINTSMGNVNALLELWRKYPYHLPIILQLSNAFHITGDTAHAMLFMDLALHAAGLILSSGASATSDVGNFNVAKTFADRTLPYCVHANRPVFVALVRGVHHALNQGCAKTALEVAKVLLSLDREDPQGAALLLDITALRGREWVWLAELHHVVVSTTLARPAADPAGANPVDCPPLLEHVALPSLHFNAALARELFRGNASVDDASSRSGRSGRDSLRGRGNRSAITPAQQALLSPPASVPCSPATATRRPLLDAPALQTLCGPTTPLHALACAVGLFPEAAAALAVAIEERADRSPWAELTFAVHDVQARRRERSGGAYAEAAMATLARLFAEASKSMWKATAHAAFLRTAVSLALAEGLVDAFHPPQSADGSATGGAASAPLDADPTLRSAAAYLGRCTHDHLRLCLHDRYAHLPEENITGVFATQIPRELLEAAVEEDDVRTERVTAGEHELLQRYEAAFGPLPDGLRVAERMELYNHQLGEQVRAIGDDVGVVRMFLQTLMPWNDVSEMALRRAFSERGVEDPAVVARRLQREHEWDVMNRADNLAPEEDLPPDQI